MPSGCSVLYARRYVSTDAMSAGDSGPEIDCEVAISQSRRESCRRDERRQCKSGATCIEHPIVPILIARIDLFMPATHGVIVQFFAVFCVGRSCRVSNTVVGSGLHGAAYVGVAGGPNLRNGG